MAQERDDVIGTELTTDHDRDVSLELSADRADAQLTDEDATQETEKIKDQIEGTRKEMGETIDAIQERLSFNNISEQVSEHVNHAVETAKGAVYDATVGKVLIIMKNLGNEISTTSFGKTVKNNPLPFVLIGAGVGMLAYHSYSGTSRGSGRSQAAGFSGRGYRSNEVSDTGTSSTIGDAVDGVKDSVSSAADSVTSAAGTAYDKVSGAVDQAYNKAGEFGGTAREQYDHYLEEKPLAVGAVALALGAAVGFAIPATRYEGQLMGQAKRDLMEKAQDTATGFIDKGKQAVSEAGKTLTEQAASIAD